MDMHGMPWFRRGMIAPPESAKVSERSKSLLHGRRTLGEERLVGAVETHELGDGGPEYIEVEETDARACGVQRERGGEVHWRGRARQRGRAGCGEGRTGRPATVLLPTPPLPLATARTAPTCGMDRFWGGPPPLRGIWGGGAALRRGRPCVG